MSAWYKRWRKARLEKKFRAAISFLERQRPEMFQHFIADRATALAAAILMDMLDKEGLRHCWRCPSRQQIAAFEGRFYCPEHLVLAKAQKAKEDSVAENIKNQNGVPAANTLKLLVALFALLFTACRTPKNRIQFAIDLPENYVPINRDLKQDVYDAENTLEREYTTVISAKPSDPDHKIYIATFILELKARPPKK